MPAELPHESLSPPGSGKVEFALFKLAVSAMNVCGICIASLEQIMTKAGVTAEAIHTSVRICARMAAVPTVHAPL